MKVLIVLFLAAAVSVTLIGCATSHGFGKDVEKLGHEIQEI